MPRGSNPQIISWSIEKILISTTGLCVFQVYIRPDLEEDVVRIGDKWYIDCRRLVNGAAWGLMKALTDGCRRLRNGTCDTKVLEMVAVDQHGWYDVVDVLSALPMLELPDL